MGPKSFWFVFVFISVASKTSLLANINIRLPKNLTLFFVDVRLVKKSYFRTLTLAVISVMVVESTAVSAIVDFFMFGKGEYVILVVILLEDETKRLTAEVK